MAFMENDDLLPSLQQTPDRIPVEGGVCHRRPPLTRTCTSARRVHIWAVEPGSQKSRYKSLRDLPAAVVKMGRY